MTIFLPTFVEYGIDISVFMRANRKKKNKFLN